MRRLLLLLAFAPSVAGASGTDDEQFARDMLICGYKLQAYGFAPGDAVISQQAAGQVALYLGAAAKVTDAAFIERETPAMKKEALDAALSEFATIEGGQEGLLATWGAVKQRCDQQISAHPRAAE